jgi:hypothetical protein
MIGDIHYLNSGDWVESLTAIVEHLDGRFELVGFKQFTAMFPMPRDEPVDEAHESFPPVPGNVAAITTLAATR